jgi:hypothetical protein
LPGGSEARWRDVSFEDWLEIRIISQLIGKGYSMFHVSDALNEFPHGRAMGKCGERSVSGRRADQQRKGKADVI